MRIIIEINSFYDLYNMCWSGALETLKIVEKRGLEDKFFNYVEETLDVYNNDYTDTEINDFIWFECDKWLEENKGE